ncbi:MAG: cytochrome c oxidase assembly factor CtaG [Bacillota bacterium]|nr:cytochrome c oxidase assembly factor CtaG [Bacillota bacterium]
MLALQIFGFKALWSPYFLLFLLVVTAIYFLLTIKYRKYFHQSEPLKRKQGMLFVLFIFLLYIIKGSPIDLMSHLMFYVHMIQMAALVLIIPPLFIWGVPPWLWRTILNVRVIRKLFPLFTKPIIALLLFNGLFSFYHVPLVFDHVMQSEWMHAGYAILLFVVAIFMWWPLINELPEYQTLSGIKKVGYIFADGMLLTPACALIIFASSPIYATYTDPHAWGKAMSLCVGSSTFSSLNLSGPELFSSMSLIHDQQLGGVLMKIMQEIIYGLILGRVFFEWYRKDQAETERELKQNIHSTLVE